MTSHPAAVVVILSAVLVSLPRGSGHARTRQFGADAAQSEVTAIRPIDPIIRSIHQEGVAAAHAALGDEVFAAEWAAGRALSLDQMVAQLPWEEVAALVSD